MFGFFIEQGLISQHQSDFKPGESYINQLLSISHEIYYSLDEDFDVRSVFLDISKAFDKLWHDGLISKLKQNSITGHLLNLFSNFLRNRKQIVVLNGLFVKLMLTQEVLKVPYQVHFYFLLYINDLEDGLSSNTKLLADDTSLFSVVDNANTTAENLNNDLVKISSWGYQWKMIFSPDPSKQAQEVIFSRKTKKKKTILLSLLTIKMYRKLIHKNIQVLYSIIVYLLKII